MKRPIVYYAISLFIGCISTLMLFQSIIAGAVITASLFAIFFFTLDKKFFIINTLFFLIGALSYMMYFDLKVPNSAEVRVIENKGYYYIANYKGRRLILNGKTTKLKEGQKLLISGKFKKEINYSRGIIGTYKVEKYTPYKKDFIHTLYDIKKNIYYSYTESIGEEKAALVMSLCYGDTEYLTKSQKSDFQEMGVFHAVSVSGFHMAIIYKVLESVIGLRCSIVVSFIYIIFTGLQASTVRAFIMILIFKLSKTVCKNYDGISSLSFAALLILFIKPYYILDIGFTLSVLATLGILIYYKKFLRMMHRMPEMINKSLSVTLSSQIFSVPYTAFTIQNFSGGFILGNLFLLPMYSVIVIVGNLALLVGSIKPIFSFFSAILNLMFTAIEGANYLILRLCPPVSYLGYMEGIALIIIYISYLLYERGYKQYKYLPIFVLFIMLCGNYSFIPKVYYMDFFKGEAVVIKYKADKILICNYDQASAKEVINLKEYMNISKVISNPKEKVNIKLNNDLYLKVIPYHEKINLCIYSGKERFMFINNRANGKDWAVFNSYDTVNFSQGSRLSNSLRNGYDDYKENCHLYVIMFNRVVKLY